MAITIKNKEVEVSIRRLAAGLGVDLTEAVGRAVTHELQRVRSRGNARLVRMRAITDRIAQLPVLDARSDEAILGYDGVGLPQ